MPKIFSRHLTAISYSGVVLRPGENTVSDDDVKKLDGDPNAVRHGKEGTLRAIREPVASYPLPPPAAPSNPRARKPKESDKAYAARLSLLDEEIAAVDSKAAAIKTFLAAYNGMTPDERAAMYETLSAEEKAFVDAQAADVTQPAVSHE